MTAVCTVSDPHLLVAVQICGKYSKLPTIVTFYPLGFCYMLHNIEVCVDLNQRDTRTWYHGLMVSNAATP